MLKWIGDYVFWLYRVNFFSSLSKGFKCYFLSLQVKKCNFVFISIIGVKYHYKITFSATYARTMERLRFDFAVKSTPDGIQIWFA